MPMVRAKLSISKLTDSTLLRLGRISKTIVLFRSQPGTLCHSPGLVFGEGVTEFKMEPITSCMILRQDAHKQRILDLAQPRRHSSRVPCAFAIERSEGVSVHQSVPVNSARAAPTDRNCLIHE